MNEKITVEACEGRTVPIHSDDNPNGGFVILKPGDAPMEVFKSTTIRRCLRDGDLVDVATKKQSAAAPSPAASSSK